MIIWQLDCYRYPHGDGGGQPAWGLLICDTQTPFRYRAVVPQAELTAAWLQGQVQTAIATARRPDVIQVFRPQSLNLLAPIAATLGVSVQPTRHTTVLHQQLWADYQTDVATARAILTVAQAAPVPLPETLWGEQWQFLAIAAADFTETLLAQPLPYLQAPPELLPLPLGLASETLIPGVTIYGGRRSLPLATWLTEQSPMSLQYLAGEPDGLILEAGLCDRWVLATAAAGAMRTAGQTFHDRLQASRGLHFLLVQPDDSGMTFTGLWLLRSPPSRYPT